MSEPMLRYRATPGVTPVQMGDSVALSTSRGGKIWVDKKVIRLWEVANGHSLDEIIEQSRREQTDESQTRAGLACLAEAGLLERGASTDPSMPDTIDTGGLVSIVIVSYNSRVWLEACFTSISEQSYLSLEIILVDNASEDGSADWVEKNYPKAKLFRLQEPCSFAHAVNLGIRSAAGQYYLLLNPDTQLEPHVVTELVRKARQVSGSSLPCAAVAAKLKLLHAPGFINSLGNLVGALSWGTDIGLGHLDLGQFDGWQEVPSACFAAALIPAQAYEIVGPLDEGFPMYYEDSEWCYRARLLGFSIRAAPQAVVYHAFSSQSAAGNGNELTPTKLRRVTYGRLRYIARINGAGYLRRFQVNYFVEDVLRGVVYLLRGQFELARALIKGWQDFRQALPSIQQERAVLQARRKLADDALYRLQKNSPVPLIHKGQPVLTWDLICNEYLSLMIARRTRPIPELAGWQAKSGKVDSASKQGLLARSIEVAENEGFRNLVRRLGRRIQWQLMQP